MRAVLRSIVLGFLALSAAGCAVAPSAMDAFDPDQVRIIAASETTSTCIGNPRTPICAVETLRACFARHDKRLCEKAGVSGDTLQFSKDPYSDHYRILSVRTIREEDITPKLRRIEWYKPGFVDVTVHDVGMKRYYCPEICKTGYSVKPEINGWSVVSWAAWGFEDFGE